MGATRFLKNYTQEACEQALREGFGIGVPGETRPDTSQINIPHRVQEVKIEGKIIGYNIDKIYLPQSDNWDDYSDFFHKNPNKQVAGFPFSVRWPNMYAGKKYQIMTFWGTILEAVVDDSREFMSEGLEWKTKEGNKERQFVVAWKEIWQR
ncbi:MAG: hypothetical protein PHP37_04135 [Patescibacteria group bacterium]|nr:hypothetical protein [Patescibacteria group bacterium]